MSRFKRFVWIILFIEVAMIVLCNIMYIRSDKVNDGRLYRVEAKRVADKIAEENMTAEEAGSMDLDKWCETINYSFHFTWEKS